MDNPEHALAGILADSSKLLLQVIGQETNQIAIKLYRAVRATRLSKQQRKRVEALLAQGILECEEAILASKGNRDTCSAVAYQHRRAVLKRIADGFAWRFLGSDPFRLNVYSSLPSSGYMAQKKGNAAERLAVDAAYRMREVTFAIQNDITNILRVGDVTVAVRRGHVVPIEIKSSQRGLRSVRARRQLTKYGAIEQYIRRGLTGPIEGFYRRSTYTSEMVSRLLRSRPIKHKRTFNWKHLEGTALKALKETYAWCAPERGCVLVCFQPQHTDPERLSRIMEDALEGAGWTRATLRYGALSRHFGPLDSDLIKSVIPVTAFEIAEPVVEAMLTGLLDVAVIVDVDTAIRLLAEAGLTAEVVDGRLTVRNGDDASLTVLERPWNWVVYGLETLESFVRSTAADAELMRMLGDPGRQLALVFDVLVFHMPVMAARSALFRSGITVGAKQHKSELMFIANAEFGRLENNEIRRRLFKQCLRNS